MEISPGDIFVCTVEKIVGTTVFVDIEGTPLKGTIILSEVSAGRIRNLRNYVVPKKIIVCKVLRVLDNHIELSLRRVKEKEKKEALEKNKAEKSYMSVLKSIMKEKSEEIIKKIKSDEPIYEFFEETKENPSKLKKIVGEENTKKILEIIIKEKEKIFSVKKKIGLTSTDPEGLNIIKKLLEKKGLEIKYLAAGKYSIKSEDNSLKKADQKIKEFMDNLEKESKKLDFEISYS